MGIMGHQDAVVDRGVPCWTRSNGWQKCWILQSMPPNNVIARFLLMSSLSLNSYESGWHWTIMLQSAFKNFRKSIFVTFCSKVQHRQWHTSDSSSYLSICVRAISRQRKSILTKFYRVKPGHKRVSRKYSLPRGMQLSFCLEIGNPASQWRKKSWRENSANSAPSVAAHKQSSTINYLAENRFLGGFCWYLKKNIWKSNDYKKETRFPKISSL